MKDNEFVRFIITDLCGKFAMMHRGSVSMAMYETQSASIKMLVYSRESFAKKRLNSMVSQHDDPLTVMSVVVSYDDAQDIWVIKR